MPTDKITGLVTPEPKLNPAFVKKIPNRPDDYVFYAGLLDFAHQKAADLSIETKILLFPSPDNGGLVIVHARVTGNGQSFDGIGDAKPADMNRMMVAHYIRLAEKRAKGRALSDFTNMPMELLEDQSQDGEQRRDDPPPPSTRVEQPSPWQRPTTAAMPPPNGAAPPISRAVPPPGPAPDPLRPNVRRLYEMSVKLGKPIDPTAANARDDDWVARQLANAEKAVAALPPPVESGEPPPEDNRPSNTGLASARQRTLMTDICKLHHLTNPFTPDTTFSDAAQLIDEYRSRVNAISRASS